jgi:CheY-like chemotaxis protein
MSVSAPNRPQRLQLLHPPPPNVVPPARPRESRAAPHLVGGRESLLVVDDDPGIRQMLLARLRGRVGQTSVVASVAEAIAILETQHVDVIVSDHSMPGATGMNLLSYVCARGLEARFVLASAGLPDGVEELARAAGAQVIGKSDLNDLL